MKLIKKTKTATLDVSVYQLDKDMTFAQMFSEALGVDGTVSVEKLQRLLKPHAFKEKQLDELEANAQDFGLNFNGWSNFIPVEYEDGVSVVGARWHGGRWHRGRFTLSHGRVWPRGARFVLSNSTLEPSDPLPLEMTINGFTYRRV